MAKLSYAFQHGAEPCLDVSWKVNYKETTVSLFGNIIGVIPSKEMLLAGQEYYLADGSTIKVQLMKNFLSTKLVVSRNGEPLDTPDSTPQGILDSAVAVLYVIGCINIVLGLLAVFTDIEFVQNWGFASQSIFFGVIMASLGYYVEKHSLIALFLAVVIVITDAIFGVVGGYLITHQVNTAGLVARFFFFLPLFKAFGAIKSLKAEDA